MRICFALLVFSFFVWLPIGAATATTITEIIDATGDGASNVLGSPFGVTVDDSGNVYIPGQTSNNVFRITPSGTVTQIITGEEDDLDFKWGSGIAVGPNGDIYVTAMASDNAFSISGLGGTGGPAVPSLNQFGAVLLCTPLGIVGWHKFHS
jgi:streptogramin lyase